jgi:hypothetical protein
MSDYTGSSVIRRSSLRCLLTMTLGIIMVQMMMGRRKWLQWGAGSTFLSYIR